MRRPPLHPLLSVPALAVAVAGAVLDGFRYTLVGSILLFCGIVGIAVVVRRRNKS